MTQPHIPAHDADSARDAETASAPSYPQRSTAQDHSATQELPAAQDATREMPSAATIPAPPAGAVPPASAPATPAPSAQEAPASAGTQQAPSVGGAYSAPSGQPYSGYTAPASPDAFASPTVIVTKKGPGWVALLGAMLLTIGLTLGAVFYARPAMLRASTPTNLNGGTVATVPASNSSGKDWTDVAAAVSPAVVTIQTQGASSGGTGSGVIYDAQGDIVTNYHVIASVLGGGQIQVTLADGRLYSAVVVGHDKTTDLAVIRLENPPSDLTVARFASSANLEVGAPVMAIGAPLGLSNTVTTGIVSALNRPVEVSVDEDSSSQDSQASSDLVVTNAIQIDASINPGNSGGPLFDTSGAVIGINSSIKSLATSSDGQAGSIGLGFAIPSDLVVSVADQLIASGTASHGMLGVTVKAATTTVGSDTYVGAEVQDVSAGSGASAAGIRAGDVIVKVEGQEVTSPKQLIGYVRRYKAGDTVTMTIVRDGQTQDVSVRIQ
ncbi:trypsin-like peptidase domain-containing protein [Actinomyces sp. HMSC035G02]|uniref:S1C family serine protease n=1 Tax=Actinomyces sp. HMSC035G02 TaxID=1739406 RepID=UPI0008A876DC|nr:trypsin-like peptidase domain-containing protein [Actinomyces sp. HMSC035G02]OHR23530.1 trypsin [Actinomyces sp. HMSC035G02]